VEIREYLDPSGRSPFGLWFAGLDARTAARVTAYILRLQGGNTGAAKSLRGGLYELRIDTGPGYRVYFAHEGETLVILFGGGTKRRQEKDIAQARRCLAEYRARRSEDGADT